MLRSMLINEAIKTLKKKRTYISFILLFFLVPLIVLAIGNGSGYLEMQIYGQLKDSFIVFGSLTNGFLVGAEGTDLRHITNYGRRAERPIADS